MRAVFRVGVIPLSLVLASPAFADGQLGQPFLTTPLGTFGGIQYVQYEGYFAGRTSTGDYRVPYRISAPSGAPAARTARTALVEPPHFFGGQGLQEAFLGHDYLFSRGFVAAAAGYSMSTFGPGAPFTNRILDPDACSASQCFVRGGVEYPGFFGNTDDEIVVDFARALTADPIATALAGPLDHRYLSGFSDSSVTVRRILVSGLAEGVFDLVAPLETGGTGYDPQAAVAPPPSPTRTYSGKVMVIQNEHEWYGRPELVPGAAQLEDQGANPQQYRHYVVATAPHIPDLMCTTTPNPPLTFHSTPSSYTPALRAHFQQAHAWVTQGLAPPPSNRLATTTVCRPDCAFLNSYLFNGCSTPDICPVTPQCDSIQILRDDKCNAITVDNQGRAVPRLPWVELGEATFASGYGFFGAVGANGGLPIRIAADGTPTYGAPASIGDLGYWSFGQYFGAFSAAAEAQVQAGEILPEDANRMRTRAALAPPATYTQGYDGNYAAFEAAIPDCTAP
jgi:hypothetical protein